MTSLEDFKNKQLQILHELDRVCQAAGINYYLAYGTCLGAVRHQGFIPWDDDIDVFLTWEDMEKLFSNQHLFQNKYFLQSRNTDPNYCNMKLALRDSSTSYFSDDNDNQDINHGMFIDLYTLFPYPDNWFAAHKLIIDSYILRILYLNEPPVNHGKLGRIAYKVVSALYKDKRKEKKIKKVEKALKENGGRKNLASFFGDDITPVSCFKFPKECFQTPKRIKFEDYLAPCPTDPERICELTYGKTYMQFPPEKDRVSRHHVKYMSCDEPYTYYKGVYYINE